VEWDWLELHRVYVSHGLDPESFWRITPREMVARLEGAQRRLTAEHDGRVWLAWHVAAFSRQEKLPDLDTLLSRSKQKAAPQSPAEQTVMLDALFLAWGGDPAELSRVRAEREASP
jgi:hypothetical protein